MKLRARFLYKIFTIGARQCDKIADMMRMMKTAAIAPNIF